MWVSCAHQQLSYQVGAQCVCRVSDSSGLVTASTPIIMTGDGNETAVAVVGAQLRYSKFYDTFMNTTKLCSSSSNDVLCHHLCHNDVSKQH